MDSIDGWIDVNDSSFEALKYSVNVPRVKEVAADIACRSYYWDVDFKVKLFHFSRYTPIHVDAEKLMNEGITGVELGKAIKKLKLDHYWVSLQNFFDLKNLLKNPLKMDCKS